MSLRKRKNGSFQEELESPHERANLRLRPSCGGGLNLRNNKPKVSNTRHIQDGRLNSRPFFILYKSIESLNRQK